jgi:transcriptional regulator with GAF, ATPase, and Fis domain
MAKATEPPPSASRASNNADAIEPPPVDEPLSRAKILSALIASQGNVSAAARALRVHRTQFRRLLARYHIDLAKLRALKKL